MKLSLARSIAIAIPLIAASPIVDSPVVIYLAGDSTMAPKLPEKRPETGWGEMLQEFFDSSAVRVHNHARNGRSTRTFLSEGRWKAIVDSLHSGDYVFIQFGHNDASKDKTDRYTPPADFRANLLRFIDETRARGANPVLMTPVMRRRFDDNGKARNSHGEYPDIVRAVATERGVPIIDMHRKTSELLGLFGQTASAALFLQLPPGENANYPRGIQDNTHFSAFGARIVASLVVEGIREARLSVAAHFRKMEPPVTRESR
ncbi:MAG TPA: rhamnogalacturonan acetylesterase [Gemmatimonadaceae bacterium]